MLRPCVSSAQASDGDAASFSPKSKSGLVYLYVVVIQHVIVGRRN